MLNIQINNIEYQIKHIWKDLSLKEFINLNDFVRKEVPPKLKLFYENIFISEDSNKLINELTEEEITLQFSSFYKKTLEQLSNIPSIIIFESIYYTDIIFLYKTYFENFIIGIFFSANQNDIPQINDFKFKGENWYLPEQNMRDSTFGQYIEAAQVEINANQISKGNFKYLSKQIAILFRKKDELKKVFDEKLINQRAEMFLDIDMQTVWGISFFLIKRALKLQKNSQTFFQKEIIKEII